MSENNTKINVYKYILFCIIKLITIHFGKNPKNGGKPPRDNRFKKIDSLIIVFILLKNNWLINIELNIKKIMHIKIIINI